MLIKPFFTKFKFTPRLIFLLALGLTACGKKDPAPEVVKPPTAQAPKPNPPLPRAVFEIPESPYVIFRGVPYKVRVAEPCGILSAGYAVISASQVDDNGNPVDDGLELILEFDRNEAQVMLSPTKRLRPYIVPLLTDHFIQSETNVIAYPKNKPGDRHFSFSLSCP